MDQFLLIKIILLQTKLNFCAGTLQPYTLNSNVSIISHILSDIVDEYFVRQKIEFNIYTISTFTKLSSDIIDAFLFKSNNFTVYYEHHSNSVHDDNFCVNRSSIFFFDTLTDFVSAEFNYRISRYQNQPIIYIIFVRNLTIRKLKTSFLLLKHKNLQLVTAKMFVYSYFIIDEFETTSLVSIEWFTKSACDEA